MCINLHYIHNPYINRDILVKCGHCPACLQERALKRTIRIKNNSDRPGETCLFVTLTYDNRYVPYVRPEDLAKLDEGKLPYDSDTDSYVLPICRDGEVRWVFNRHNKIRPLRRIREHYPHFIDHVLIPAKYHDLDGQTFMFAHNSKINKVTVLYFKDIQQFYKRLRINLKRDFPYESENIIKSLFTVAEYGSNSARCHFHALVWCPSRLIEQVKSAIAKSWSYDSYAISLRNVEVAKNAASYVSSYVNSHSSIPNLFRHVRSLNQKHSYSKNFGFNNPNFTYDSVLEKIRIRNLHYDCRSVKQGCDTVSSYLLPQYVLNRYFPKFKGFSYLSPTEIVELGREPQKIWRFNRLLALGLTTEQEISIFNFFVRKKKLLSNYYDWLLAYSQVWHIYASNLLHDHGEAISSPALNFYAYDNIIDYYCGDVQSPTLDNCLFFCPSSFAYLVDPNQFPQNILSTLKYESLYYQYDKSRKIRASIFNKIKPQFGI